MKVHLLTYSDYDEHEVIGAYSSKAKAEAAEKEASKAKNRHPMHRHGVFDVETLEVQ